MSNPIQITNTQRDMAVAIGDDADMALANGIIDDNFNIIVPLAIGYADLTNDQRTISKNAIKQTAGYLLRYLSPIGIQSQNTSPLLSIISPTSIISSTMTTYVPRTIHVNLNFTAYSTATSTELGFYIVIGNTIIPSPLRYYFNASSDHRSVSGSWITSIPAGTSTISGYITRNSGTGVITLNSNDFISLSIIG